MEEELYKPAERWDERGAAGAFRFTLPENWGIIMALGFLLSRIHDARKI
ncbi:hypothetical protein [Hydrogenispora ethanolica]|nr:hypothetical protein [Hydrogenispora ethanolica]